MTTTRSATSSASSWSWVTKTLVRRISSCSRRSQRRSSWRTLASSEPKGSSRSSTRGSTARARARATRCRWPPESCEGSRSESQSSWTMRRRPVTFSRISASARTRLARADAQAEGHVLEDGHVAEEGVVLEDEADAALLRLAARRVLALEEDLAAVGPLEAGDDAQEARLAGAGGAEEGHELAVGHLQADVVHRGERAEGLRDVADLDAHGSALSSHLGGGSGSSTASRPVAALPPLDDALRDEGDEGEQGEERGHGEGGLELVLVVEDLDVQGQGVGEAADVAGDDRHRPELAHRAGVAEDDAVEEAPLHVGERHPPEDLPARRRRARRPPPPRPAPGPASPG